MDEHFRMAFLFQEVSSAGFIRIFDDRLPQMRKFLDELEQCAVQLDSMNKGAKISSVTGRSVGAIGSVLSIVGLALIPVTAGVSSGLIIAGVTMGVTSGANSLVTTATEFGVNRSNQKRANEAFQSFTKDFQIIQNCLEEVVEKPTISLEQSEVDVAVGVGKIASKAGTVASAGKGIAQNGKALSKISGIAANVPDIGRAAMKGPLALSKGARGGFIALNALFLGMDIFFITKDSMSLAKGTDTKLSKFLRERIALFRSQIESWEKICDTLRQSKLTSEENRDFLKKPFFQVRDLKC